MLKKLPKNLWPYFWDVDPQTVNIKKKAIFVIGRLLDKGDTEAVSWVLRSFPIPVIKKVFSTIRDMNPKTGNFWQIYLKIPKSEVLCLQQSYLTKRKSHWPF